MSSETVFSIRGIADDVMIQDANESNVLLSYQSTAKRESSRGAPKYNSRREKQKDDLEVLIEELGEENEHGVKKSNQPSVLVCDDCPFNIIAISGLLEQFNVKFETCDDGERAYEMVKARADSHQQQY